MASRKDSRTKVVLARKLEKQGLGNNPALKLKITFPFYGKGTGIRKCYEKGIGNLRLVIPGIV